MRVLIDTESRDDATMLAESLPGSPETVPARGYGLIATRCRDREQAQQLLEAVESAVERHGLRWVRVRVEDDHHVFRADVPRTPQQQPRERFA